MANNIKKNRMAKTSLVGAVIIGFFLLLVGTVKVTYKVVKALVIWYADKKAAKSPRGIETSIHRVNGGNLMAAPRTTAAASLDAPEFADTIPVAPVETELRISSRIHIAQLMQGDVRIGRIWFYTYDKAGKIRRVFKVDDRQVRKFMGTERFYMTDVDWDPTTGEQGIETIKKAAFDEVMSLMMARLKRSGGTKKQLGGNVEMAKEAAPAATTPKAPPAPAPVAPVQAIAPTQVVAPVATANVVETKPVAKLDPRPAKGDKFAGVIAEMGRVKRPGGRDGQGYFAYCLKLDQNGKHTTHYGVEIERELLERNCAPGDTVELTYMGRQQIDDTTHKNLFKIDVIKRQNGQKGAN